MVQGSSAWLAARSRRVGGSDIAVIMRISPYKTRRDLWKEKTGRKAIPSISHLPHVKRGIDAEPIARSMLERELNVTYTTPVIVHPAYPWAVASLDGICPDHTLEIKTMSAARHEDARLGTVPLYYVMQVQWGLMCSGLDRGLFASFRPEDGTIHKVWIDADHDLHERMLEKAEEFIGWVNNDKEPPDESVIV